MLEIDAKNLDDAIAKVASTSAKQADLRSLAKALYGVAESDIAQRFGSAPRVRSSAEVYGGAYWSRLSERYLQSNPRRQSGVQLIDTGLMRRSFVRGGTGNIAEASANEVRFGSNLERAVYQHRRRMLVVDHQGLGDATAIAVAKELGS